MDAILFSEPLTKGRIAYERIARLQQEIIDLQDRSCFLTVDLGKFRTGLRFIFLLSCLYYFAQEHERDLRLAVDRKTFNSMKQISVPGISTDGMETHAKRTGFRLLREPADVIELVKSILVKFPVKISDSLGEALQINIGEVFNNANDHAGGSSIIGGWYTKPSGMFCLSCYDTGIGIPESVNRYRESKKIQRVPDNRALEWAMKKGNTTSPRRGAGLGLDLLKSFCKVNGGAIHICSGNSMYTLYKGEEDFLPLDNQFHGTFFEMSIVPDGDNYFLLEESK